MIRAGTMREVVDLLQQSTTAITSDSVGEPIVPWPAFATGVPARCQYLDGIELFRAQKINAEAKLRATLRYRTDVGAEHRLRWDGRDWNIHSVTPDEHRTQIVLLCSEVK